MPNYFVKYSERDNRKVVVMHASGRVHRNLTYVRAVEAPDEATVRREADRLSTRGLQVEIIELRQMTVEQERVFPERLILGD